MLWRSGEEKHLATVLGNSNALQDIRVWCQTEKIERRDTGRSQLGQQWHTHSTAITQQLWKKHFSAVFTCFCLKIRCAFLFFPPANVFICCSKVKGRLYCTSEMNSLHKRGRSGAISSEDRLMLALLVLRKGLTHGNQSGGFSSWSQF